MVFLTGLMGSGKSTVGRRLAEALGWRFADTDALVEKAAGSSVAEIFRERGESAFRLMESRALRSLKPGRGLVVATGGGLPVKAANRAWMRSHGLVVHLALRPEEALRRLNPAGRGSRPLLKGGLKSLQKLAAQRARFYVMAQLSIPADDTPARLSREITRWVKAQGPAKRKKPALTQ